MHNMTAVKYRIPERASAFINMKTVLTRLEKRGHLDSVTKILAEVKAAEEAELLEELGGDLEEIESYSRIFKENAKVLLSIIVDEVWNSGVGNTVRQHKEEGKNERLQNGHSGKAKMIERSPSPDSDHTRPYSLGPDDQAEEIRNAERPVIKSFVQQKVPAIKVNPQQNANTVRTGYLKPQVNSTSTKNMSGSTLELSRSRSPVSKTSISKAATTAHFRSAKEKTQFYNTLSEFSTIRSPGTFPKERKITKFTDLPESPGPAKYNTENQPKSPGGIIGRGRRMYLINEREASNSPGPHDYQPKYHFIAKH